jgi:hypothetical protein
MFFSLLLERCPLTRTNGAMRRPSLDGGRTAVVYHFPAGPEPTARCWKLAHPPAALALLARRPAVAGARGTPDGIRPALTDPNSVGAITVRLIGAGIAIYRFSPVRASLEDRFLQITSHVGIGSHQ